jgi:diguanylate cyclase (GGDEF)-like protein
MRNMQPEFNEVIEQITLPNGDLLYNEFEKWWAEGYLMSDKTEFLTISNNEYLLKKYSEGEKMVEFFCKGKDKNGNVYDCKKVFYISKDELIEEVTALCVMYDISEENLKKHQQKQKDAATLSMCDEFRSIAYVNLDDDSVEFYREDEELLGWCKGINNFSQCIMMFADKHVVEEDRMEYKYNLSSAKLRRHLSQENTFKYHYRCRLKNGEVRYFEEKIKRDFSNEDGFCIIIGTRDVQKDVQMKKTLEKALEMAHTDHLTGLYNQQGLAVKCAEVLEDRSVHSAVLFMDLDNFKNVNDRYGHSMGDKVLYEVGNVLKEETRGKDVVGRYGGDEFVALLYDANNEMEIDFVLERISRRIASVCDGFGLDVKIGASIGVAFTFEIGFNYRHLKEIADDRLYLAKKRGKNIIVKNS